MINKSNNNISELKTLRVGFTTLGWPLKNFPSGIVTYIQNLIPGFGKSINPIILAGALNGKVKEDCLVDLRNFHKNKSLFQKLLFKMLYLTKLPLANSILYRKNIQETALTIHKALEKLDEPLDILEMEESFGTAILLMKMNAVSIVTRIHGPWIMMASIMGLEDMWDYKYRVYYEGEAIMHAHGVTAPSFDVLDKVKQFYGVKLPNARVIPNPVAAVPAHMQWKLYAGKKPTILFVGRFDLLKGGDLVLEAFRYIALKHQEIELMFVGPDQGVKIEAKFLLFKEYLERFIPEPSIKKRIQFFGHCDSVVIAQLRMQSLVTIVCSRYESFSISLVEALAAGCPTVATAVGGIKEIIIDEYNGLLAEPESAISIAEKVLALIANPEKMQKLSKNAIEDCKKRFAPEVIAAQTIDYYRSVLAIQAAK